MSVSSALSFSRRPPRSTHASSQRPRYRLAPGLEGCPRIAELRGFEIVLSRVGM